MYSYCYIEWEKNGKVCTSKLEDVHVLTWKHENNGNSLAIIVLKTVSSFSVFFGHSVIICRKLQKTWLIAYFRYCYMYYIYFYSTFLNSEIRLLIKVFGPYRDIFIWSYTYFYYLSTFFVTYAYDGFHRSLLEWTDKIETYLHILQ